MDPMRAADMTRQRESGREKGKTTAAWDRVNGMKALLSSNVHIKGLKFGG
jgi:hypothetical protein